MPMVAPADKPPAGGLADCWEGPDVGGGGGGGEEMSGVVATCEPVECDVAVVKIIPAAERGMVDVVRLETDELELGVDVA